MEPGLITVFSSWSLRSATSEPSQSPGHAGFSDAPKAMVLVSMGTRKSRGGVEEGQMSFLSKSASVG